MEQNLTMEQLERYESAFDADLAKKVAMRAVTANGIVKAATNPEVMRKDRHQFSVMLEQGKIIERGDHESLLRERGRYYQLYTGQAELS